MRRFIVRVGLLVTCLACCSQPACAAELSLRTNGQQVPRDVLEAEAEGLVEVKYIPNDSRSAQIVVANRTDQPLTLRLPDAFTGVPVLAQLGMGGMGGMGGGMGGMGGGMGGMGGGQTMGGGGMGGMGGGMGGMGGGMGGMGGGMGGMGGGLFSVPPEKTRVVKVATVCLEHGKDEPSPRLPYRLARLEQFSDDPALAALLVSLGRSEIPQRVAQAAAWHLSSGLSWQALAAEKIDRPGGVADVPYFSPNELYAARQVVMTILSRPENRRTSGSTGRQIRSPGEG